MKTTTRYIVFFAALTASSLALAVTPEEENSIIKYTFDTFDFIQEMFFHAPTTLEYMFAYVIEYVILISLKLEFKALEFSHGIAVAMLDNLSFDALLNSAFSNLPTEQKAMVGAYGIGAGMTRIVEAMTTRFVMDFIGA